MKAPTVAIWCPSGEGHLVYTTQLAHALESLPPNLGSDEQVAVLTTYPVPPEHVDASCRMECVSPRVRHRDEFDSFWRWFVDRLAYHPRREWALLKWLRKHPTCHIVHLQEIHELTGPLVAWAIRRVLRRRLVYTMHNVLSHRPRGSFARAVEIAWTRRLLLQAEVVIVHSQSLKQKLLALYDLRPASVTVIPIGIKMAPYSVTRQVTSTPVGEGRVLFYGTLRANKGLHHLLDCFAVARPSWTLRIAGQLADRHYFRQEIEPRIRRLRDAGIAIEFLPGYVPDTEVHAHLTWASVLVLPYDGFEAQSGVLLDAIIHRVPVVVTNEGALAETVSEFQFGVVAESHAPEALELAIRRCLELDPCALESAWARIEVEMSPARMAERTMSVYSSLRD